jgi:hypothetical protein
MDIVEKGSQCVHQHQGRHPAITVLSHSRPADRNYCTALDFESVEGDGWNFRRDDHLSYAEDRRTNPRPSGDGDL